MLKEKISRLSIEYSIIGASGWACIQVLLAFGIEKKSFFQIFADILGGGAMGMTAGLVFFIVFGAIGWVSGAIYGAIGIFTLMVGGALGGMGLGALVHVARNPDQYVFNWPVLLIGTLISFFLVKLITARGLAIYDKYGPNVMNIAIEKLDNDSN